MKRGTHRPFAGYVYSIFSRPNQFPHHKESAQGRHFQGKDERRKKNQVAEFLSYRTATFIYKKYDVILIQIQFTDILRQIKHIVKKNMQLFSAAENSAESFSDSAWHCGSLHFPVALVLQCGSPHYLQVLALWLTPFSGSSGITVWLTPLSPSSGIVAHSILRQLWYYSLAHPIISQLWLCGSLHSPEALVLEYGSPQFLLCQIV